MELKAQLSKWSNFFWTPEAADSYVIEHKGRMSGIGRLAHKCPAAFNVAWATTADRLHTLAGQRDAVDIYAGVERELADLREVGGFTMVEALTFQTLSEFLAWYGEHRSKVPKAIRAYLESIPHAKVV